MVLCLWPLQHHLVCMNRWMVMPMGLCNSAPVHQWRVADTLWELIGKVCHIYLDKIIIWSSSLEEHDKHVWMVTDCLRKHRLWLNGKKSEFFAWRWTSWATTSQAKALKWTHQRLIRFELASPKISFWHASIPGPGQIHFCLLAKAGRIFGSPDATDN